MPFDRKEYYHKNKDIENATSKEYYRNNKDKIQKSKLEYYHKNKDKLKEYRKAYRQTEQGRKSKRIADWKKMGVVCDDFDGLYEHYKNATHCDICNVELSIEKKSTNNKKCLDHDHETGEFRWVLCFNCNKNEHNKLKSNLNI